MVPSLRPLRSTRSFALTLLITLLGGTLSAQTVMLHFGQALNPHEAKLAITTVADWDPGQETKLDLPPVQAKVSTTRINDLHELALALHIAQVPFVGYTVLDGPSPQRVLVVHGANGPILITDFPGPDADPTEKAAWAETNPEAYQQLQRLNATTAD